MTSTNADRWTAFTEGVGLVFKTWSAFQLAVDNFWGGNQSAEKAEEIKEDIIYWFTLCKNDPDVLALQDQLMAAMLEDFNTEIEDGSISEVASNMVTLYHECRDGDQTLLAKLRASEQATSTLKKNNQQSMECDSSSSSSDEPIEEIAESSGDKDPARRRSTEIDGDGFTIVRSRRRR